jgi:tripartite ATP-independent transporter DctM subunit
MVLCTVIARRRNYAPAIRASWADRGRATWSASWALMMPVIIILGLRFGIVTDTEAAAVATIYALVVGVLVYRSIDLRSLPKILATTGRSTGAILFLLAAAGPFSWLVAESQVGAALSELIRSITTNPTATLLVINGFLLLIGCIIEPLPAMIIFVPTLLPLVAQLGIDPIHFGAVVVLNLMIGMLHPPIGLLLFVVSSVGRVPIKAVMIESLPFLGWSLIVLLLATVIPQITLWLPGQL